MMKYNIIINNIFKCNNRDNNKKHKKNNKNNNKNNNNRIYS